MGKNLIDTFLELREKYATMELAPLIILQQRPNIILEDFSSLRSSINCVTMHVQNLRSERNSALYEWVFPPLHKTDFFVQASKVLLQRLNILEGKTKELKFMLYRNAYIESKEGAYKQLLILFNDVRRILMVLKEDDDTNTLISYIKSKRITGEVNG